MTAGLTATALLALILALAGSTSNTAAEKRAQQQIVVEQQKVEQLLRELQGTNQ